MELPGIEAERSICLGARCSGPRVTLTTTFLLWWPCINRSHVWHRRLWKYLRRVQLQEQKAIRDLYVRIFRCVLLGFMLIWIAYFLSPNSWNGFRQPMLPGGPIRQLYSTWLLAPIYCSNIPALNGPPLLFYFHIMPCTVSTFIYCSTAMPSSYCTLYFFIFIFWPPTLRIFGWTI